jgi:RimJ/RimL family protein N-acetyltransferase
VNFEDLPQLAGDIVTLKPLSRDDAPGLRLATADGELWRTWYTHVPAPDGVEAEIERRLGLFAEHRVLPWTVWHNATESIIGMTSMLNIDPVNRRVEIGSTWLAKSAQRTGVNAEAKLLLLNHAFESLDCIAVELRTHWHNSQSRAAIAALGAKQDGVLRSHSVTGDGILRDTVVFSIVAGEWPAVRLGLTEKLAVNARRLKSRGLLPREDAVHTVRA